MTSRLLAVAIVALAAVPALAAPPAHDDTAYPDIPAAWAGTPRASEGEFLSDDVAYPGPHASLVKGLPQPVAGAGPLARADDTTYPTAEGVPLPARPVEPARLACGCARR